MSEDNTNRRELLKGMSAVGMFGLGSSLSVSVAAADGSTSDPVSILSGVEKLSLARDIAETDEFDLLLERATEMGYRFEWETDNLDAGRVEADSLRREVVAYELDGTAEGARAGIIIGRNLDSGVVEFAQLDIERYGNDGLFQKLERYEVPVGPASVGVDTATDEGIEKRVIEPDPATTKNLVDTLQSQQDDVTTQASLPDLPDVLNISTCSGCYYASKLICRTVCGAFGGFICGLLGISVIGAVGCVTFVKAVCWVAEKASGCGDDVAATLCKSSGLDVCGPNESGDIIAIDIPYI